MNAPLAFLLEVLHECVTLSSEVEIKQACELIVRAQRATAAEVEVIRALFERGPLFDGDVPSKQARDELVREGFVSKVVVNGDEGYNACTYSGARLYRLFVAENRIVSTTSKYKQFRTYESEDGVNNNTLSTADGGHCGSQWLNLCGQ